MAARRFAERLAGWRYPIALGVIGTAVVWFAMTSQRIPNTPASAAAESSVEELSCNLVSQTRLPLLTEASSLALSRRTPATLWSLNDSGASVVVALDTSGNVIGRVRVTGANVSNWEDVSVASCGTGSCLYVADTGDRGGTQRNDVVIYRVREPAPTDKQTTPAEVIDAAYPDGEDHEADAMFVMNDQLFLITKGHPSLLFRFPSEMDPATLVTLERAGEIPTERFLGTTIPRRTRVTDAETSPDGRLAAIRTNEALLVYRTSDLLAGRTNRFWHADLKSLDEPRGEGVAISDEGDVFLAGEGTGQRPGTFAHLKCSLPHDGFWPFGNEGSR